MTAFPRWNINYSIEIATITLLLEYHDAGLSSLKLRQCIGGDLDADIPVEGLYSLRTGSMMALEDNSWPGRMVVSNQQTLRDLELGAEYHVIEAYNDKIILDDLQPVQEITSSFIDGLTLASRRPQRGTATFLPQLESLRLCGINLTGLMLRGVGFINVENITTLVLESCINFASAVSVMNSARNTTKSSSVLGLQRLSSLVLRYERTTQAFRGELETFLVSLPPLKNLSVLLEGSDDPMALHTILDLHGKTLRTLLWDERPERRNLFVGRHVTSNLKVICQCCPELIELGLSINWSFFTANKSLRLQVCHLMSRASKI